MSQPKEKSELPELSESQAQKVLAEYARRKKNERKFRPEEFLFEEQLAFFKDKTKLKAACCSRRAGKSVTLANMLVDKALTFANSFCLFATLNQAQARKIIWPPLVKLNEQFGLGMEFRNNDGVVEFPNGSKIILKGISTRRDMESIRGPSYPIIVIDEAQALGSDLTYFINECAFPATMDYGKDAVIAMTGTPNARMAGVFYEAVTGRSGKWSVHNWTYKDNIHIPDKEQFIKQLLSLNHWTENHPSFRREYKGEWIRDLHGLVFRFDRKRHRMINTFRPSVAPDIKYTLGIDLGFVDATAFVVMAHSRTVGQAWVVECYQESGLTPSSSAKHVKQYREKYPGIQIVADSGGLGKPYVEEWIERHGLPVMAAEKTEKYGNIAHLNGDLDANAIHFDPTRTGALMTSLELLQWDADAKERGKYFFDRSFEAHLPDAFLYAWRSCMHGRMTYSREEDPLEYASREWHKKESDRIKSEIKKKLKRKKGAWWQQI